ncbi:hypothetical protein [Francisella orientalis]|uniref:Uncharacterized protein n=1 Tax=Francisella orientalis TaxID=299583 RepID=A0AAP6X6C1_9GAMM|nr:hypothetical protein [Francisella orientalis]AFJ43131.1 hypothetical protein OOM_0623 [Francisella orientalis str. Toba 04]AHB98916.1 membrane protein [Francisella orientalis LADL 07-285A]AKN86211.1 hypothetical protein FNO12_1695 [Francisella orientalis FNO12]AKN87749.1 Hypothetical protein FNO24_1697 [Francisella orientalis FNO24]AKN89287.1 Hypothetical protein FNO190_1695 [Francisella orientalis]
MCEMIYLPLLADDLLRVFISIMLFLCCVILSYIFVKRKPWDVAFWICFSVSLFGMGSYGYVAHHIYLENTFSYDGFISGAAFITVCGLLFSRKRYFDFNDNIFSRDALILFATFFVFAFIYIFTIKYNFDCVTAFGHFFIDALQIVIYPLLLLFAISTFLYRFSICLSAFAISMALFIVENGVFILNALTGAVKHKIAVEEISFATISMVLSCIAVFMLTRAKRIYMENKKNV